MQYVNLLSFEPSQKVIAYTFVLMNKELNKTTWAPGFYSDNNRCYPFLALPESVHDDFCALFGITPVINK